jgi:hypothetical protein
MLSEAKHLWLSPAFWVARSEILCFAQNDRRPRVIERSKRLDSSVTLE